MGEDQGLRGWRSTAAPCWDSGTLGWQSEPFGPFWASGSGFVTPPPHEAGLLHSCGASFPPRAWPQTLLTDSFRSEGQAEAPALVGSPLTHGAGERSQLTWQPEGRDSHKQQGWDHRVDLGCSPAPTHSTRPASAATPHPALVGHREKVGMNLGKSLPQRQPGHHLPLSSQEGATSLAQPVVPGPLALAPPLQPQGPRLRHRQGEPGSQRQWRRWGLGSAREHLLLKSSLG